MADNSDWVELGASYELHKWGQLADATHATIRKWAVAPLSPCIQQLLLPLARSFYDNPATPLLLLSKLNLILDRSKNHPILVIDKNSRLTTSQFVACLQATLIVNGQPDSVSLVGSGSFRAIDPVKLLPAVKHHQAGWPVVFDLTNCTAANLIPVLEQSNGIFFSDGRMVADHCEAMTFSDGRKAGVIPDLRPVEQVRATILLEQKENDRSGPIWQYLLPAHKNKLAQIGLDQGIADLTQFDYEKGVLYVKRRRISQAQSNHRMQCLRGEQPFLYRTYSDSELALQEAYYNPLLYQEISTVVLYFKGREVKPNRFFCKRAQSRFALCERYLQSIGLQKAASSRDFSVLWSTLIERVTAECNSKEAGVKAGLLVSYLNTPGLLHCFSDAKKIFRNVNLWSKSGDLTSLLVMLGKYLAVEQNQKRKQQEPEGFVPDEESLFSLFDQPELRLRRMSSLAEESVQTFHAQYYVNNTKIKAVLSAYSRIKAEFQLPSLSEISTQFVEQIVACFIELFPSSVLFYSGARKKGFKFCVRDEFALSSKQSLFHVFGERPSLILALRLDEFGVESAERVESHVLGALSEELVKSLRLNLARKESVNPCQLQFQGVSAAVFSILQKEDRKLVSQFEENLNVEIEINHSTETIVLQCQHKDKEIAKERFEQLLTWVYGQIETQRKELTFSRQSRFIIGQGGGIKEILQKNETVDVDLEGLGEGLESALWEHFTDFNIQRILWCQPSNYRVVLESKGDVQDFIRIYNNSMLEGATMLLRAAGRVQENCKPPTQLQVIVKWFNWLCGREGYVQFKDREAAAQAAKELNKNWRPELRGEKVIFSSLPQSMDEIQMAKTCAAWGEVALIELNKQPQLDTFFQERALSHWLSRMLGNRYQISSIKRHEKGMREAKVVLQNQQDVQQVKGLDMSRVMGKTLTHTECRFVSRWTIKAQLAETIQAIITEDFKLFEEFLSKKKAEVRIKQKAPGICQLKVITRGVEEFTLCFRSISKILSGNNTNLNPEQAAVLNSLLGREFLKELEAKFRVSLNLSNDGALRTVCEMKQFHQICLEVKNFINMQVEEKLPLSKVACRHLACSPKILEQLQVESGLTAVSLDDVSKDLTLRGRSLAVLAGKNALARVTQQFIKGSAEELKNPSECGICYSTLQQSYRLQLCSHKFCTACIKQHVATCFGNKSLFPIGCPQCLKLISLSDLQLLLDGAGWEKLLNLALVKFMDEHKQYAYCMTAQCKGICVPRDNVAACSECETTYCLSCKVAYHRGLTCIEYKEGHDGLLKKYMKENDVRICPNEKCKSPIQKADGCNRITCVSCQQSICWRCMAFFKTASDCYNHLNEKHGGYW